MKVLYIAPEHASFVSVGGVGVVARDLPPALARLGVDAAVVVPLHGGELPSFAEVGAKYQFEIPFLGQKETVQIFRCGQPETGTVVWFVANETHFGGRNVYASDPIPFESDVRRYSFFARACLELVRQLAPDIIHVNDWTGGYLLGWMELANLRATDWGETAPFRQRRVLTIHNIGYQGQTWKERLDETDFRDLMDHPVIGPLFNDPHLEYDCVNPMRLAMELADVVNAVSPTNADEMTRPENRDGYFSGGQGLEDIARRLVDEGRLTGILNGMNYLAETPACRSPASADINAKFDPAFEDLLNRKRDEKATLSRLFVDPGNLLIGFVGRAVEQKFKLLTERLDGRPVFEHLLDIPNVNVLVLATGEAEYEAFLTALSIARFNHRHSYDELLTAPRRRNYAAILAHDPALGRRIRLGCDVFLMPSLFEPCGIAQLESLAEATPPLVRATGGLKDTVIPHTEPQGTGFTFDGTSRDDVLRSLVMTVREAARVHRDEPARFRQLQYNAWRARFPWSDTASRYLNDLYEPTSIRQT